MSIKESGEMYLETILVLTNEKISVRAIDIVDRMGFSKPSVSRAIAKLKTDGYITVDDEGYIELTDSGYGIAEKIYERHTTLTELLVRLGVDESVASEDACKIEHDLSDTTFEVIKKHLAEHS